MFKALIIDQAHDNAISASVEEVSEDRLPQDGEVDIAVEYSTVNYKDGLCLNGLGRLVKTYPHVPGVDFAGSVINSSDDRFKPGDRSSCMDGVVVKSDGVVMRQRPMKRPIG